MPARDLVDKRRRGRAQKLRSREGIAHEPDERAPLQWFTRKAGAQIERSVDKHRIGIPPLVNDAVREVFIETFTREAKLLAIGTRRLTRAVQFRLLVYLYGSPR